MTGPLSKREIVVGSVWTELLEGGSGTPLLFLHSGFAPDAVSDRYLSELADNFHVIAPWHPGFGASPRPQHFRDVGDLAYFYLDLAQHLQLGHAVLVGAGLGGWIASEMCVRSTAAFDRLVLVDPFGLKVGGTEMRDFADFWAIDPDDRLRLEFVTETYHSIDYASCSDEALSATARSAESEAYFGWQPFMHNPQLGHWLHRIDVPTLILRGRGDRVIADRNHLAYADLIPDAELGWIEHAGHHPHVEQPQAVAAAIRSFAGPLAHQPA